MFLRIGIDYLHDHSPPFCTKKETTKVTFDFAQKCLDIPMVFHGISWFNCMSWYVMVFHGISWYFLVFLGISWYFMVFHGISWYFLVFLGISWYVHGISWYFLVCSWYFMVFHGFSISFPNSLESFCHIFFYSGLAVLRHLCGAAKVCGVHAL